MTPFVKRIVLLGGAVLVGGAILYSSGGLPFQRGLPPANPAAISTPSAPAPARPTPELARPNERLQELQRRLAENPRDAAALAELVDGMMQARRYAQAADLLFQAIEAGVDTPRLRVGLGLALFYQGIPSMAQRELKRAIEADPDLAEAHYFYGLTLSHGATADLEAARAAWQRVVQLDGDGELGRRARELLAGTPGG